MLLECEVEEGLGRVEVGPGRPAVVVGRHQTCDLRVANPTVSRRHCEFRYEGGRVEVVDLGSTAGTWLNGQRVDRAEVHPGDEVRCGRLAIAVREGGAAAERPGRRAPPPDPEPPRRRAPPPDEGGARIRRPDEGGPAAGGGGAPGGETLALVFTDPEGRSRTLLVGPAHPVVTMGRNPDVDARIRNATVSRKHCTVSWTSGGVMVEDLGSTAGTRVNGRRVDRAPLAAGDVLMLGEVKVRVVAADGAPPDAGGGAAADVREPMHPTQDRLPPGDLQSLFDAADPWATSDGGGWETEATTARPAELDSPLPEAPRRRQAPPPEAPPPARAAPSTEPWELAYTDPEGIDHRVPVVRGGPPVLVGRSAGVGLRIDHPTVSRKHCELAWLGDALVLTDLQSTSGTLVNGRKVERAHLQLGDVVSCGGVELTVVTGGAPVAQERPRAAAAAAGAARPAAAGGSGWAVTWRGDDGREVRTPLRDDGRPVVVGRNAGVDIRVQDPSVSREHCQLAYLEGGFEVRDLGSSAGTKVNDTLVERAIISAGDRITCGHLVLTVEGPAPEKVSSDDGWDAWEEEGEIAETGPPTWHLVYLDVHGRLSHESLDPTYRVLAIGSDRDCDITGEAEGLEADHCEITWEEGVLVATDLKTDSGTTVNGERIEDHVLRNGDVIGCGALKVFVVRGSDGSMKDPPSGTRSMEADTWARHVEARDPGLCVVFSRGDEQDPRFADAGRQELTLWADGEARVEEVRPQERASLDAQVRHETLDLLLDALLRAGFPDVATERLSADEPPVELAAYQGDDRASVLLGRRVLTRSDAYREAVELCEMLVAAIRA